MKNHLNFIFGWTSLNIFVLCVFSFLFSTKMTPFNTTHAHLGGSRPVIEDFCFSFIDKYLMNTTLIFQQRQKHVLKNGEYLSRINFMQKLHYKNALMPPCLENESIFLRFRKQPESYKFEQQRRGQQEVGETSEMWVRGEFTLSLPSSQPSDVALVGLALGAAL